MTKDEILNLNIENPEFHKNFTIRDYFCELLITLWEDGESFSGKRPFGNSGWEYDLYTPLVIHGVIGGKIDEDGDIEEVNTEQADNLIRLLIAYCFYGGENG